MKAWLRIGIARAVLSILVLPASALDFQSPKIDYTSYSKKVIGSLAVNGIVLIAVVLIPFGLLRSRKFMFYASYEVRRHLRFTLDVNDSPGNEDDAEKEVAPQFYSCGFYPLGRGKSLQRAVGLDGVVVIRFATMCLHFCVMYSLVAGCLCFYYHVYGTLGKTGLISFQISNMQLQVSNHSNQQEGEIPCQTQMPFSVAVISAYLMCFVLLVLIQIEYNNFCAMRTSFLEQKFPSAKQKKFCISGREAHTNEEDMAERMVMRDSVLVERVPPQVKNHYQLKLEFERLFGKGTVERAVLCTDISELRRAVDRYLLLEEDEEALQCDSFFMRVYSYGPRRIPYRLPWLYRFQWLQRRGFMRRPELQRAEALKDVERHYRELEARLTPGAEDPSSEEESSSSGEDEPASANLNSSFNSMGTQRWYSKMRPSNLLGEVESLLADPIQLSDILRSLLETLRTIGRTIITRQCTASTGFVTFKSHQMKVMATQMVLQQHSGSMKAVSAPFPKDIIWDNMGMPRDQRMVRKAVFWTLAVIIALFWSGVATLVQIVAQLKNMVALLELFAPWLVPIITPYIKDDSWYTLTLNGFLSALALLALLTFLPLIMRTWFEYYEGHKCRSKVMSLSFGSCFAFNLITMYVTVFAGSFIQSGETDLIKTTTLELERVAKKMDSVAGYFMCYILTKIGVRMVIYLLRPYSVLPWFAFQQCKELAHIRQSGEKREPLLDHHQTGPLGGREAEKLLVEAPFYDWILTDLTIALALVMMYAIIAPVITLVGATFFMVYTAWVRYNFAFVYVQAWDSGGEFFFKLIDMVTFSLVMSLLMLQGYLLANSSQPAGPVNFVLNFVLKGALPVLVIIVICLWRYNKRHFKPRCRHLALEAVSHLKERKRALHRNKTVLCGNDASYIFVDPAIRMAANLLNEKESLPRNPNPLSGLSA